MSGFQRFIGIDYSGAATSDTPLAGLRVYVAGTADQPHERRPHATDPGRHWTRRQLATWLSDAVQKGPPTIIGIDHGFSFPLCYFEENSVPKDWPAFLSQFSTWCPTHETGTRVEDVRSGHIGGLASGDAKWRRLTDIQAGAKSVFHFDVPGSVAKSTHAGLPWLLMLREQLRERLHFWPFDGWRAPAGASIVAEAYPALWSAKFATDDRTADQHDAYTIAASLQRAALDGSLTRMLEPDLNEEARGAASVEGWILGIT